MKLIKILILSILTLVTISCSNEKEKIIPTNIYYRLYQVDYDGNYMIFDTQMVTTINGRGSGANDWWVGLGGAAEAYCNAHPDICSTVYDNFPVFCDSYPAVCNYIQTKYPDLYTALPIELLFMNLEYKNGGVYVKFQTATEIESDYIAIESSLDGSDWIRIKQIKSECPLGCEYSYFDNLNWL